MDMSIGRPHTCPYTCACRCAVPSRTRWMPPRTAWAAPKVSRDASHRDLANATPRFDPALGVRRRHAPKSRENTNKIHPRGSDTLGPCVDVHINVRMHLSTQMSMHIRRYRCLYACSINLSYTRVRLMLEILGLHKPCRHGLLVAMSPCHHVMPTSVRLMLEILGLNVECLGKCAYMCVYG